MQVLYFLESIRNPVLDAFFAAVTHFGSETLFLAIAIICFWCVSKKSGYYLLVVGFFGTLFNQALKLIFRIPRPWVKDPDFPIVEAAREEATGYSFPSGHTQNAVSVLGCPARSTKKPALRIVFIVLILLTGLSRLYLGVHTPLDVVVSLVIGTALVLLFHPLFEKMDEKPQLFYLAVGSLFVLSVIYTLTVQLYPWGADVDAHNLESGLKNGYLLIGCSAALLVAFPLEKKYINYDVSAPWWAQILKVVLGLGIVMGLKAGLKPVLKLIWNHHLLTTSVRYAALVLFAALIWPRTFVWFQKGCPMGRRAKKALIVILCILLALAILAGTLFWAVTRDTKAKPIETTGAANGLITPLGTTMLSGHRAGGGIAPENTMAALKNCVENGEYKLDVFEFDIHLTSDNIPVLLHDGTLDRTSDAVEHFGYEGVRPENHTLAELKELNMGAKFVSDDGTAPYADLRGDAIPEDLRITTLDEALTYLEESGEYHYIIEVKNSDVLGIRATNILYETLVAHGCLNRTVVGTFHNEITAYMDETYPDLPRSAGFNEAIRFYLYAFFHLPASADTFNFVALQIPTDDYTVNLGTSRVINYAHKLNIAVQYWTINDPEEMAKLQAIGADCIMTDVPNVAAEILVQP
ncbi:MAG: phosphatase PAP2 family protein [Ruminococcaceae bacterium]|nr:phosphatase PAP2 family protein [Oscillospiraceae bacterium]